MDKRNYDSWETDVRRRFCEAYRVFPVSGEEVCCRKRASRIFPEAFKRADTKTIEADPKASEYQMATYNFCKACYQKHEGDREWDNLCDYMKYFMGIMDDQKKEAERKLKKGI